jgi:Domain of unknown function (DUF4351)
MLRHLLEKRFGAPPGWATEKLTNCSVSELEELGLHLLDAHSLEELLR